MTIDHLRTGERLPVESGFVRLDPEWVWTVRDVQDQILAGLIACRAHDVVILIQLFALGELPFGGIHQLLRRVRKDCRDRGLRAFMGWHHDQNPEAALYRALEPNVQSHTKFSGEFVAGRL